MQLNFLKSLLDHIVDKLKVQFGNLDNVSDENLVIVAIILESQTGAVEPPIVGCSSRIILPLSKPTLKWVKCYRCGLLGYQAYL